ncbi:MAG: hypothetical protein AAB573_05245 [Patescibacteria group bacterium]
MTEQKRTTGMISADVARIWDEQKRIANESGLDDKSWARAQELVNEEKRLRSAVSPRVWHRIFVLAQDQTRRENAHKSNIIRAVRKSELWRRREDVVALQLKRQGIIAH